MLPLTPEQRDDFLDKAAIERMDEVLLFMETMQRRANTLPSSMLLNEIVNYAYDRIDALLAERDRREQVKE